MHIREAAVKSELPVKTVRYYDEIGLIEPARSGNGYRTYEPRDVHKLRFVQRARSLGFTIAQCRQLLSLYSDGHRASADVKAIARERMAEIDRKIGELQSLRRSLGDLIAACHGDDRPDCPILDGLAGPGEGP